MAEICDIEVVVFDVLGTWPGLQTGVYARPG